VIHTPGHDNDCVCWYDLETKTIITGDSLQANGTICQGVGFYKSLPDYLRTLERLNKMDIENILCGHDYEGIGYWIEGKERVKEALAYCRDRVDAYHRFILARKDRESAQIATELINELGCGMPERLFMALYTVTEHLNYKGE
jgi:glyoxylase-like metal-dependent hydrolase (beta-lactamase superfamily II)